MSARTVIETLLPDGRVVWADGLLDGLPIWRWGTAPTGLCTGRQLASQGLRRGGQDPVGLVVWTRRGCGRQLASLYDVTRAVTVRPMTAGRWRSVEAMLAARRVCSVCGPVATYTRYGLVDGTRTRFCAGCWRDDRAVAA